MQWQDIWKAGQCIVKLLIRISASFMCLIWSFLPLPRRCKEGGEAAWACCVWCDDVKWSWKERWSFIAWYLAQIRFTKCPYLCLLTHWTSSMWHVLLTIYLFSLVWTFAVRLMYSKKHAVGKWKCKTVQQPIQNQLNYLQTPGTVLCHENSICNDSWIHA